MLPHILEVNVVKNLQKCSYSKSIVSNQCSKRIVSYQCFMNVNLHPHKIIIKCVLKLQKYSYLKSIISSQFPHALVHLRFWLDRYINNPFSNFEQCYKVRKSDKSRCYIFCKQWSKYSCFKSIVSIIHQYLYFYVSFA